MSRPCIVSAQMTAMSSAMMMIATRGTTATTGRQPRRSCAATSTPTVRAATLPEKIPKPDSQHHDAEDEVDPSPRRDVELEHVLTADHVELVVEDRNQSRNGLEEPDHHQHHAGERCVTSSPTARLFTHRLHSVLAHGRVNPVRMTRRRCRRHHPARVESLHAWPDSIAGDPPPIESPAEGGDAADSIGPTLELHRVMWGRLMAERYEIVTAEPVGSLATDPLEDLDSSPAGPGRWRLVGSVPDAAALLGVLHRLADLHVELIEVRRIPEV